MGKAKAPKDLKRLVQGLIAGVLKRKQTALKPEEIEDGMSLTADLGIDSLDILQILAVVEKKYGVRIPEAKLRGMDDLAGILKTVGPLAARK